MAESDWIEVTPEEWAMMTSIWRYPAFVNFEQIKDKPMDNEITLDLLPGVKLVVDTDALTIEQNVSLSDFSANADLKIYLDFRIMNVLTKEQSEVKSMVILRTK